MDSIGSHTDTNRRSPTEKQKYEEKGTFSTESSTDLPPFTPPLDELKKKGRNLGVNRIKEGIKAA